MTTHKEMRADLDSAFHTLTHPHRKVEEPHEQEHVGSARNERPRKHLHVHELHDGSYHVEKDHGGEGEIKQSSAADLDSVHDALEEHFGEQEGGEHGEAHSHY